MNSPSPSTTPSGPVFQRLLDAIPHIAWLASEGRSEITYINARWLEYTGYADGEVSTSQQTFRFIHPDDLSAVRRHMETKGVEPYEIRILSKEGEYRWFRIQPSPLFDAEGKIEGWIGTATDVDEEVKIRESLRQSETLFRSTFENAAVGIGHLSLDGRWLNVNQNFSDISGYSKSELLELALSAITYPEDLRVVQGRIGDLLAGECENCNIESRYVRKDGVVRWASLTLSLQRDDQNLPVRFIVVAQDIQGRKQAEQGLRESEAALRKFHDCSPLLMGVVELPDDDADIFHIYDSPATKQLFGASEAGTTGRTAMQLGAPKDVVENWIKSYRASESSEKSVQFEYSHPTENGQVWLSTAVSCLGKTESGRTRFCYVAEDITHRKLAEEEQRQSREELERLMYSLAAQADLLELAHDAILVQSLTGSIKYWNRSAERKYGWSREEALGKNVHDLLQTRAPLSIPEIIFELERSGYWEGDLVHTRRDGSTLIVSSKWAIRRPEGQAPEILEIVSDVTEQRSRAEVQNLLVRVTDETEGLRDPDEIMKVTTRLLGQHLRVATCVYGEVAADENTAELRDYSEGVPSLEGRAQLEHLGPLRGQLLGTRSTVVVEAVSDWAQEAAHHELFRTLQIGAIVCTPLFKDGRLTALFAVHNRESRAWKPAEIELVKLIADRSWSTIERARVERALQVANAELEERVRIRTADLQAANEQMETFTYHVSHDLRGPLRAIMSTSRIIQADFGNLLPDEALVQLDRQAKAALSLGALIDDLLKLSRLAREEIQRVPVDLTDLARTVATDMRAFYPQSTVVVEVQEGLLAIGDARLLKLAFQNLIDNAVKYSPEGGTVRIGSRKPSEFFVADEGIGIDPQYLSKIFEPFQRLHRTEEFAGTGIGLANVKQVVERHRGKIWAESAPGKVQLSISRSNREAFSSPFDVASVDAAAPLRRFPPPRRRVLSS